MFKMIQANKNFLWKAIITKNNSQQALKKFSELDCTNYLEDTFSGPNSLTNLALFKAFSNPPS